VRLPGRILLLIAFFLFPLLAQGDDAALLRQAKISMFDQQWESALNGLRELQSRFPNSALIPQALFYEALALEKSARKEPAILKYRQFLNRAGNLTALKENARRSMVELSVQLYREGNRQHIQQALDAVKGPDSSLRNFAAIQLSYISDAEIAEQAVPALRQIAETTDDPELRNQATLALLRINPSLLRPEPSRPTPPGKLLRLQIIEGEGTRVEMNFPLSLAQLLINALPENARLQLREKGIEADSLMRDLQRSGNVLDIQADSTRIRIWIE
jgi:hypothetical protein